MEAIDKNMIPEGIRIGLLTAHPYTPPFQRGKNVVDLRGCYSNLEALNELVAAVST